MFECRLMGKGCLSARFPSCPSHVVGSPEGQDGNLVDHIEFSTLVPAKLVSGIFLSFNLYPTISRADAPVLRAAYKEAKKSSKYKLHKLIMTVINNKKAS